MEILVIRRYYLLAVFVIVGFISANSQVLYSETEADSNNIGRVLKINLTKLAANELGISYEHFLTSNTSIEAGFGLVRPAVYLQEISHNFYYNGFAIDVDYKVYGKGGIMKDIYFSPLMRYKNMFYDEQLVNHKEDEHFDYDILQSSTKQTYTLAAIIGARYEKFIIIDVYVGFGIRYSYESTQEFENYDNYSLLYWRPNTTETTSVFPTAHFGIKLGYDLNH